MFNTDLAKESIDRLNEKGINPGEKDGILIKKEEIDDDISIITVEVINEKGSQTIGKPIGKYLTIEFKNSLNSADEADIFYEQAKNQSQCKSRNFAASKAVSTALSQFISHKYGLKVLICGLGNENVTPDALGPKTATKVKVTRHLFEFFGATGDENLAITSVIFPRVLAMTGIETCDLIIKAVEITKPNAVIAIDSLAAGSIERVGTTIQIANTGIAPGAGMGNKRKQITKETIGCDVIAIGVPTVIGAGNLLWDFLESIGLDDQEKEALTSDINLDMIVTCADIDTIIDDFSKIIADAINMTLHKER